MPPASSRQRLISVRISVDDMVFLTGPGGRVRPVTSTIEETPRKANPVVAGVDHGSSTGASDIAAGPPIPRRGTGDGRVLRTAAVTRRRDWLVTVDAQPHRHATLGELQTIPPMTVHTGPDVAR